MIFFERFGDSDVHIAELTAVALVEDDNDVFFEDGIPLVFFNEDIEFLNGGDNNSRVRVFDLSFKNGGGSITVRRTLLEAIVFLHGLIGKVFSVDHKQNLVDMFLLFTKSVFFRLKCKQNLLNKSLSIQKVRF